jgi:hypothetical protein
MAPVSISASAGIMTAKALANRLTRSFRATRIATGKCTKTTRGGGMKEALRFVAAGVAIVFLEPVTNRAVQNGGHRNAAKACLAFQISLQFAGQAPAINFRLHALQCSASGRLAQGILLAFTSCRKPSR